MVTKRTTSSEGAGIDGPAALKAAIHVARARAGITSDVQLSIRADVHYDTLMNWYGGRTVPRPHELKKVATVLGIGYGDLMDAYEGRPAQPPSLIAVLERQIRALEDLTAVLVSDRARRAAFERGMLRSLGALTGPEEAPSTDLEPLPRGGTER